MFRKENIDALPRVVTAKWLTSVGACESQVARFRRCFPKGTTVTAASVIKAMDAGLPILWLGTQSTSFGRLYAREYSKADCEWNRDYDRTVKEAQGKYPNKQERIWDKFHGRWKRRDAALYAKVWRTWRNPERKKRRKSGNG